MRRKLQVFVSSTYSDLIAERQFAVEAILKAQHIPAGMELFSAGSESQLEIIKRWIGDSDIYMLILGARYGSLEPNSRLSYTEIEYKYALELNKPIFAIVASDDFIDKKVKDAGKAVLELEHVEKFGTFKAFVLSRICSFFDDEAGIKLAVFESLLDIQARFELDGWVRSTEVPDVRELIEQITELKTENSELRDQLAVFESAQVDKIGQYSFEELVAILGSIEVVVPDGLSGTGKFTDNVLNLAVANKERISVGLYNNVSASDADMFLIAKVVSHLRIYDLADIVNLNKVAFQMFRTSKLGNKFFALYSLKNPPHKTPAKKTQNKTA